MLLKEDIQELLDGLDTDEAMTIHYDGFIGRGINGTSSKYTCIKSGCGESNLVEYRKGYDDETKVYLTYIHLKDNYIKASYRVYEKGKFDKEYRRQGEYTVIVPYDRISSIDIIEIKR